MSAGSVSQDVSICKTFRFEFRNNLRMLVISAHKHLKILYIKLKDSLLIIFGLIYIFSLYFKGHMNWKV